MSVYLSLDPVSAAVFSTLNVSAVTTLAPGGVCDDVAQSTGYPMRGVRFVHVLAYSVYPRDEPELSGKIHIRRALGGPAISLAVTVLALVILLVAQTVGGFLFWIALWFFLDNLLVFFLGAFLPLGFTDGSSILKWLGKP